MADKPQSSKPGTQPFTLTVQWGPERSEENKKPSGFAEFIARAANTTRFIVNVAIIVILGSVAFVITRELFFEDRIIIAPIKVPKQIVETYGYSGDVVSAHIQDGIYTLISAAEDRLSVESGESTSRKKVEFVPLDQNLVLEVPQLGISIDSLIQLFSRAFNVNGRKVTGEIICPLEKDSKIDCNPDYLALRLRYNGKKIGEIPISDKNGMNFIENQNDRNEKEYFLQVASNIMWRIDPYSVALYYVDRREFGAATELLQIIDHRNTKGERVWAVNLLGVIAQAKEEYREAITQYGRAIQIDPKFSGSRRNRARLLIDLRRHDEALEDLLWLTSNEAEIEDHQLLVDTLISADRPAEALAPAVELVQLDSQRKGVIHSLMYTLRKAGNLEAAELAAYEFLRVDSTSAFAEDTRKFLELLEQDLASGA